jgi:hypothetical protein
MEYPISEIVDRLSIVRLKKERIGGTQFEDEYRILDDELRRFQDDTGTDLTTIFHHLYRTNGQIWDLEADIRRGKEGDIGLEEVGRRALEIRNLNKVRIAYKNEITTETGGFLEIKGGHASE